MLIRPPFVPDPMRAPSVVAALLVSTLLAGCTASTDGACDPSDLQAEESGLFAVFETSHGCFVVELYPDDAPKTVDNFVKYAEDDFYQGTIFHRIIPGFVIQGGGFTEDGRQKETRDPIPLEANRSNLQWTLSMARTQDPNSATSQFFVNLEDNRGSLDPNAQSAGYAVFGIVVSGFDTIESIRDVETGPGPQPGMQDWPQDPPVIEDVTIHDEGYEAPPPPEPAWGLEAGLITDTQGEDGTWTAHISADPDHIPFWVRNTGNQEDKVTVRITSPARWNVTMQPADIVLQPHGTRAQGGYAYATPGLFTIDPVPGIEDDGSTEDVIEVVFQSSDPETSTMLTIALDVDDELSGNVSAAGTTVSLSYTGKFDDGKEFDSGSFETTLGSGRTVAGFDFGLIGLAEGESTTIRFPPELGYGHDNPEGSRLAKFNGEWLTFDVTIDAFVDG